MATPKRTPIKALPSTLASAPSSGVPPPTGYENHVKAILRERTQKIFIRSCLLCLAFQFLWSWWFGPNSLTVTLFSSIVLLCGAIGPLLLLRKFHLTTERQLSPTPAQTFSLAFSPTQRARTIRTLLTLFMSGMFVLYSHTLISESTRQVQLRLFVKSKKHPLYLNSHILYLGLLQFSLSVVYTLQLISMDRFIFPLRQEKFGTKGLLFSAVNCAGLLLVATPLTLLIFGFARLFLLPFIFRVPLLSIFLKPFAGHFLRRASGYTILLPLTHLPLIFRGFWLTFATVWTWDVTAFGIFDDLIGGQIRGGTVEMVVGALGSKSTTGIEQYFALCELGEVAKEDSTARRESIYNSPALWSYLLRQSLLILGRDYQHLLRRGAPLPPPTAPPPPPTTPSVPTTTAPPVTPLKTIQSNIYKSPSPNTQRPKGTPIRNILNSILNDEGDVNKAAEEIVDAVFVPPSLASSTSTPPAFLPPPPKQAEQTSRVVAEIRKTIPVWVSDLGGKVNGWWKKERVVKKVGGGVLKWRERDLAVVVLLSHLTSHSLTEDKFGTIQRDIPKMVEAILSYLSALEAYSIELQEQREKMADEEKINIERALDVVVTLESDIKSSFALLARTFNTKLGAFKWPLGVGEKVERWVLAVGGM